MNYSSTDQLPERAEPDAAVEYADPASIFLNMPVTATNWHGQHGARQPIIRKSRRRMNCLPILIGIFAPWATFGIIFVFLGTSLHKQQPVLTYGIAAAGFILWLFLGFLAYRRKNDKEGDKEPTWLWFMFVVIGIAVVLGIVLGCLNYKMLTLPSHDVKSLNSYGAGKQSGAQLLDTSNGVDPVRMRGQQLLDAGLATFVSGTFVDRAKAVGFKSRRVYCVAPLALANKTVETYDFWAVGVDCCSGTPGSFLCSGFNSKTLVGMRSLDDQARPFYRLAVQQAESAFKIKANHPLFFNLGDDPLHSADRMDQDSKRNIVIGIIAFGLLQVAIVAIAILHYKGSS